MKTAFIVNPVAGRGRTDKIWPRLEKVLQERGIAHKAYFTNYKGEATELAKALCEQVDRIVVAGGDGTLHEVVQSIAYQNVQLAILPTGTGNDLVRSLGIPRNPFKALELLFQGDSKKIDVGEVNGRYFINVAGVGFDAEVTHAVNMNYKHIKGSGAYLLALVQLLASYRNVPVKVTVGESQFITNALAVAVGNGSYYGGGMKIVPGAILDDGFFHICLVGDVTKLEIIRTLPKIFSGRHVAHPKVVVLKGKEIHIEAGGTMVLQADGEIIGQAPAVFRVRKKALEILVPKNVN